MNFVQYHDDSCSNVRFGTVVFIVHALALKFNIIFSVTEAQEQTPT